MIFYFQQERVWAKLHVNGCVPRLSPFLPVQEIRMTAEGASNPLVPWQGFMRPHEYLRRFSRVLMLSC